MSERAMSPQEEEFLALAAIHRLGECTALEVANDLGLASVRRTLDALEWRGRVVRRMKPPRFMACAMVAVYSVARPTGGAARCSFVGVAGGAR